ncbi:MAG: hypothetical protein AAFY28_06680 [Actinomycetota bacterium]
MRFATAGLLTVLLALVSCGPAAEDRKRLATIRTDPLLQVAPDQAEPTDEFEVVADTEYAAFGRSSTAAGRVYDLPHPVDGPSVFALYEEYFLENGWSDIVARCTEYDRVLFAKRQQGSYVVTARVRVRNWTVEDEPIPEDPARLGVSVSSPHHRNDGRLQIVGDPPLTDCDWSLRPREIRWVPSD